MPSGSPPPPLRRLTLWWKRMLVRYSWLIALIVGAVSTAVGVVVSSQALPIDMIVLLSMAIFVVAAAITEALGSARRRVPSLWISTLTLLATIVGSWIYEANTSPERVNYVANHDVVMSGEAGAPPRQGPAADALTAGEENSAYCYVRVDGVVWLRFESGWAPLSELHRPHGEAASKMPAHC